MRQSQKHEEAVWPFIAVALPHLIYNALINLIFQTQVVRNELSERHPQHHLGKFSAMHLSPHHSSAIPI